MDSKYLNYDEDYTPETNEPRAPYRGIGNSDLGIDRSSRNDERTASPRRESNYNATQEAVVVDDETEIVAEPRRHEQPRTEQPRIERQSTERQSTERPRNERQRAEQPRNERQRTEQPRTEQPRDERQSAERPRNERPRNRRREADVPDGEKRPWAIVRFIRDERTHVFAGVLLLLISIFVVIAVFSHFQHGATDQSTVINMTLTEAVDNNIDVQNVEGKFGAWLSQALLCDALGIGSLMLVIYFGALALSLFKLIKINFWGLTFRCLLLSITISIVLGLITYDNASVIYWGGNHGHYINKFLIDNASIIGAILVSVMLVFAVICVYLNVLKRVWASASDTFATRREQLAREHEHRREAARRRAEENPREDYELDDEPDDTPEVRRAPAVVQRPVAATQTPSPAPAPATNDISLDNADDEAVIQVDNGNGDNGNADIVIEGGDNFTVTANDIEEGHGAIAQFYDPRADLSHYRFPTLDLLEERPSGPSIDMEEQQANKRRIEETLRQYNIGISRIEATVGPTVTLYEIVPAEGVRISQIKRLEDDIALSLSAIGIRIIAPIPGKGTVGIEVPNNDPKTVSMYSVINSRKFRECKMALPMAMGATISNEIFIADMAKMPHLLVAGATGMGKSVGLNVILSSLLYKKHPSELKLVLVDPKMVEFSLYSKLERHYLAKLPNNDDAIITDMRLVIETLNSLCVEMENRYELLRAANVRSLEEYNKKFTERRLNPEKGHKYLPYIVVVVDEFADLIMTQGKEVETPIARIAQKARAVGIHMILATQRPSTNVITGLIKANFPGRIAFRVIQMVDSRTILDCPGANQLIGRGDMLFSHNGSMERVQCAFVSTEEVENIVNYIDDQVGYEHAYYLPEYVPEEVEGGFIAGASTDRDALFNEAARFIVQKNQGSTSLLQRQFGIGYNRAGKIMDQMEAAGIVGPINGSKPRNVLINDMATLDAMLGE